MKIQLWSYNYDPEPLGIAPVSATFAREMSARGHDVLVVAAHPHYPEPDWGVRLRAYREVRDGVSVLRLPIWPGRASALQRVRQEMSFVGPLSVRAPLLPRPDVLVAVSPSFPALVPAGMFARLKRVPWILWLQDILPDGAISSGIMREGRVIRGARRLESWAYRRADSIVVLSEVFRENLLAKGVHPDKIERIYNPVTRPFRDRPRPIELVDQTMVLCIGNIGQTQNLVDVVERFQASEELRALEARLVITGEGVAADAVRDAIRSDRVEMRGVVSPAELDGLLARAGLGLVSSNYAGAEFNIPSKLMNYMGFGLPVVAAVGSDSEVARIVRESGCGWIATQPEELMPAIASSLADRDSRETRGRSGWEYARARLSPSKLGDQFEALLFGRMTNPQGGTG